MKHSFENNFNIVTEKNSNEKENILKLNRNEHLTKNFHPIMACLGGFGEFKLSEFQVEDMDIDTERDYEIDYNGKHENLIFNDFKNPEEGSYVISPVDSFNKFSKSFANCTGVFVSGYDSKIKKNVSFASHEDPNYFLQNTKNLNMFKKDLSERLNELKNISESGSIDAAIFGGNFFHKKDPIEDYREFQENYIESVKLLANEIKKAFGFEPIVIVGPKTTYGVDNVYFDNKNRRLYIARPEVGKPATKSFMPSELESYIKKI